VKTAYWPGTSVGVGTPWGPSLLFDLAIRLQLLRGTTAFSHRYTKVKDLDMSDTVETLVLDLLEWVGFKERTYTATMEAWRTSCPKLQIWEDANDRGLVETACVDGESLVRVTVTGLAALKERRPRSYDQLLCLRQQSE
jgi:hypothetical protein